MCVCVCVGEGGGGGGGGGVHTSWDTGIKPLCSIPSQKQDDLKQCCVCSQGTQTERIGSRQQGGGGVERGGGGKEKLLEAKESRHPSS